jgi:ABC-type Zn uptake system ZnuABC Zn-binding protein ZnuA
MSTRPRLRGARPDLRGDRSGRLRAAAATLAAALLLAACGGADGTADGTDRTEGTDGAVVLSVTATVSPLAELVAQVGGTRVEVRSLVPSGADAHTYAPRPRDAMRLEDADVYVGIGLALNDGAVRLARANLRPGARLTLLGEEHLDVADLVFDHPADADAGVPRDAAGLGPNPHVWTSLRNVRGLVRGIVKVLSEEDPAGAEHYTARGDDLLVRLGMLDDAVTAAVATIAPADRVLVTYHDAWIYFARDYGLDYAIAVQGGDYADPSAAGVRALIDQVRALGVRAVFGSRVFPSAVLEVIAAEAGATYVAGLSDDALPGEPGEPGHTYLELMRQNAAIIVGGLGGDTAALETPDVLAATRG